ncbi:MAG: hypothetical protein QM661_15755 [Solimonas sp.]
MNEPFRFRPFAVALLAASLFVLGPSPRASAHEGAHHGDHNPHHGGAVLMYKTIHYEVVLLPAGGVQLYVTDEMRADLPATTVSDVTVQIERPDGKSENVDMALGPTNEYWQGSSAPVTDVRSKVHVAFVFEDSPVVVSIPGSLWPALAKGAGADMKGMKMDGMDMPGSDAHVH